MSILKFELISFYLSYKCMSIKLSILFSQKFMLNLEGEWDKESRRA
jgi:hypothetical protein